MEAKQAIAVAALVALTACGGSGGGSAGAPGPVAAVPEAAAPAPETKAQAEQPPAKIPTPCTLAVYGDSIIASAHVVDRLHDLRPRWSVSDHSAAGLLAAYEMPRFLAAADLPGAVVVLQWGMNDALQKPYALKEALRAEVQRVKALGKRPVITGLSRITDPRYIAARDMGDVAARQVAEEEGATFADWGSVPSTAAEMFDPIHPGAAYHARLIARLAATLDTVSPECAS